MVEFLGHLFDTSGFPPRWNCGCWATRHGWLHILSDRGVWSAYVAIPCVLGYFLVRRKDLPFRMIFLLFIAFILACGTTHLMEAIIFWWPLDQLASVIKLFTALVSWATVLAIVPVTPTVLAMRGPEDLEREIAARRQAEDALRRANAELEQRIAERTAALRESEERHRLLVELNPDAVLIIAGEEIIFANPAAARLLGVRSPQELVGRSPLAFIHPEFHQAIRGRWQTILDTGEALPLMQQRWLRAGGGVLDVETTAHRFFEQGRARVKVIARDVSERKRTEAALRLLAEAGLTLADLRDVQSTLDKVAHLAVPSFADWCAVDMIGDAGQITRVASALVDPAKEELTREAAARYPLDWDRPGVVVRVLRSGAPELIPEITDELLEAVARDAEHLRIMRELDFKSYLVVPLVARGRVLGAIAFALHDPGRRYGPADLELAQELARRAAAAIDNAHLYQEVREGDRRKEEFLAVLSHELRNPLAPIRNALQIMHRPDVDPAVFAQVRDMLERQVQQMVRLVDDLLDVSRITRGKLELRQERVELSAVVRGALEISGPLIEEANHQLTVRPPAEPLAVVGDPTRLAQVLANLLNNAAKYTPEGGHIGLTVERAGGQAVVRVRDDGVGIPAEMLPHVFEMFMQADRSLARSQGGLGIGLTLVRTLVEKHGGGVEVRSEGAGKGSEFTVRLPLAPDAPEPPRAEEGDPQLTKPARLRVLVVDDNVDSARSLAMLMELLGHEVRVAHDGESALEAAAAFVPDVILLDIGLPKMDGYEVARRVRATPELKEVVLIAQTGWGQEGDRRRSAEAGCDHHLVKPVDFTVLENLLAGLKPR